MSELWGKWDIKYVRTKPNTVMKSQSHVWLALLQVGEMSHCESIYSEYKEKDREYMQNEGKGWNLKVRGKDICMLMQTGRKRLESRAEDMYANERIRMESRDKDTSTSICRMVPRG